MKKDNLGNMNTIADAIRGYGVQKTSALEKLEFKRDRLKQIQRELFDCVDALSFERGLPVCTASREKILEEILKSMRGKNDFNS